MTDRDVRIPRTPIYVKTHQAMSIPDDERVYYLLTRSGLFIGRNTSLMRSLAPARQCPAELAPQEPFLQMRCPRVPAGLVATILGFFKTLAFGHGAFAVADRTFGKKQGLLSIAVPLQLLQDPAQPPGSGPAL